MGTMAHSPQCSYHHHKHHGFVPVLVRPCHVRRPLREHRGVGRASTHVQAVL